MNFPTAARGHKALRAAWLCALDALFPPRCASCAKFSGPIFCKKCAPQLRLIEEPCCERCGKTFDSLARSADICANCRQHPPAFERARACWAFQEPARGAIHSFKYNRRFAMAPRFAHLMLQTPAARAQIRDWQPQCLVPVALHASRARARGFNQSALLARELGFLCDLPALDLLKRTRATPPQVGLDLSARRRNVRAAFAIDATLWQNANLAGARILLIDDVFTTGATINECARVLLAAGAGEIGALTIARGQSPGEPLPPEIGSTEINGELSHIKMWI